jgi:hypothetical protein
VNNIIKKKYKRGVKTVQQCLVTLGANPFEVYSMRTLGVFKYSYRHSSIRERLCDEEILDWARHLRNEGVKSNWKNHEIMVKINLAFEKLNKILKCK